MCIPILKFHVGHMLHQNSETQIILQEQKHQTLTLEEKLSNFQSQLKHQEEVKTHELRDMEHDFKNRNDSLHFEIGKLKSALDQKVLNEGTLQEKLKFTQQALNLAEDQVKDLLRRDQSREDHLRKIHDNCNSFEKDIRQVSLIPVPTTQLLNFLSLEQRLLND